MELYEMHAALEQECVLCTGRGVGAWAHTGRRRFPSTEDTGDDFDSESFCTHFQDAFDKLDGKLATMDDKASELNRLMCVVRRQELDARPQPGSRGSAQRGRDRPAL